MTKLANISIINILTTQMSCDYFKIQEIYKMGNL